jgi:hypothetical protein
VSDLNLNVERSAMLRAHWFNEAMKDAMTKAYLHDNTEAKVSFDTQFELQMALQLMRSMLKQRPDMFIKEVETSFEMRNGSCVTLLLKTNP